MNDLIDESIQFLLEDHLLHEMANLGSKRTGLEQIIFVSNKGGARHAARIKVSNIPGKFSQDDNFSLTIDDEPKVVGNCKLKQKHLDDISDWVKLNKEHLLNVWNDDGKMDVDDVLNGVQKL